MVLWPAFEMGVFGQNTPGLIGLSIATESMVSIEMSIRRASATVLVM